MKKEVFKKILIGLLALYFIYCIHYLFVNRQKYQWDFRMQYYAAKLFAEGKNPYDVEVLRETIKNAINSTDFDILWYAYPPVTLWFYRLFTLAEYNTAYNIFLILKVITIIGLVLLWRIKFLARKAGAGFYFFCLLAFNSAIFIDLTAGNINMFEELMLWIGFYFFLERRLLPFCCFILLAACVKMTPLIFLGMLLLTDNKKKYLHLFGSCTVFAGYMLIQYAVSPVMFRAFLTGAKEAFVIEKCLFTPSTLNIIKAGFIMLAQTKGILVPNILQLGLFGIVALAVILVSGRAYLVLKSLKTDDKEKIILFLVCIVYALIHPRMKDYAYVLLIVPSYFIITRSSYSKIYPFLFALAIISSENILLPGMAVIYDFMWFNYPLIIAYLIWGLYLYEIFSTKQPCQGAVAGRSLNQHYTAV